jgi:hypothetical protein
MLLDDDDGFRRARRPARARLLPAVGWAVGRLS